MSTTALLILVGVVAFVAVLGLAMSLAVAASRADDEIERMMERPVFIGSGFLDVGAVFEWPERDS